jgi:hypothetical protein
VNNNEMMIWVCVCIAAVSLLAAIAAYGLWALNQRLQQLEAFLRPPQALEPRVAFVPPASSQRRPYPQPQNEGHLTTVFKRDANGRVC